MTIDLTPADRRLLVEAIARDRRARIEETARAGPEALPEAYRVECRLADLQARLARDRDADAPPSP